MKHVPMGNRRRSWLLLAVLSATLVGALAWWVGGTSERALAAPAVEVSAATLAEGVTEPGVSNDYCLGCHGKPNQVRDLPSGEQQYLTIDSAGYNASVHGSGGYACVQCHTEIRTYPHPESTAQDLRDVTLQNYESCRECHASNFDLTHDSVHQTALDEGNRDAAVCSDCHNPHYQKALTDPSTGELWPNARLAVPQTCARCHSAIYDQYKQSVHGAALLGSADEPGGNADVPTCIDCHGVHNVADPTTASFRLDSPQTCAKCHTDPERMGPYDLSTHVLDTYIADFHGTTVTLFERENPDQETNKPVCSDCHGVHDIRSVADPQKGLQVKQNLLGTCQKCHPDATASFPDSWLSHYVPSADKNPLVYFVDVFYQFFIPIVVGGMVVFVLADAGRRIYQRVKGGAHA